MNVLWDRCLCTSPCCVCVCVCVLVRGLWWSCREISLFSFRNISIWAHRDNQLCLTESNNCMMAYFRIQFEMNIKRWYFSLLVYMINACGHAGGCCNWSCLKSVFGSKHEAQKHILTLATSYNLTRFMKRHSAEQNALCLLGILSVCFVCYQYHLIIPKSLLQRYSQPTASVIKLSPVADGWAPTEP